MRQRNMRKSYYLCSMKVFLLVLACAVMVSCGGGLDGDADARQTALRWADAYFNCDYHEAAACVTDDSQKWLRFAASNTTAADLELLRNTPAIVQDDDIKTAVGDSVRVVSLTINNYLDANGLGDRAKQLKEGRFLITVVVQDGDWKVRMEGLPRSEKQSRD